MQLNFKPRPIIVAKILAVIAIVMAVLSLISEYLVEVVLVAQTDTLLTFSLDLFSVNLEESIPTWYSVLILFVAAILLAIIAWGKYRTNDSFKRYWMGLAVIFLYFSMDEGAAIHEIFADPLQLAFNATGFFTFGWQIVAIPLVIIFALLYLRFLFHLPPKTRNLFIVAAVFYAGGALIIEGISANQWSLDDNLSMTYLTIATIEEFFEILGVSIFIYTLLDYIQMMDYTFSLNYQAQDKEKTSNHDVEQPATASVVPSKMTFFSSLLLVIVFLVITNIASLAWILNRPTSSVPQATVAFYQPIITDLEASNVLVMEMQGIFGANNIPALDLAASLLNVYPEVTIVALPASGNSIIFAGDSLPFQQNTLADLLHANGQVEFIIYETDVVSVFASSVQP